MASNKLLSEKKLLEGMTSYNAHADELATISQAELGLELSESEYKVAMKRIEDLLDATPGTQKGDEFEKLISLTDAYESEHYPI